MLSAAAGCLTTSGYAQLLGTGHCGALQTSYTNGAANDTIYYYPTGQTGTLTVSPENGVGPFDFIWQVYNSTLNLWAPLTTVNDQPESTQSGLAVGGYRVSIYDASNNLVGCYRAWIGWTEPGTIQVNMNADCLQVNLWADITPGSMTGYFNPPPDPLPINANTEIQVCFSANHSFVSDLGFYLVGPPSCGSPTISLAPNPGSIGMGAVCNSGNNISNLCFSTESAANFNVCTAAVPLTGTFGSYGVANTPINWSGLFGCDATASGWSVQIYDCIGLDVGALTDVTLTFSGVNICGQDQDLTYTTPPGFSSSINDNSCSPGSASIFTVPLAPPVPIDMTCGFEWNADPYWFIADSTTSLNITVPAPPVQTVFSLDLICYDQDGNPIGELYGNGDWNCPGGGGNNSVVFNPIPWITPLLSGPMAICQGSPFSLTSDHSGGVWSGPGVDPLSGNVAAGLAAGSYLFTYDPQEICYNIASIPINVTLYQNESFTSVLGSFCDSADEVQLGFYNYLEGPAISEIWGEYFLHPNQLAPGSYSLYSAAQGFCTSYEETILFEIVEAPEPSLIPAGPFCITESAVSLESTEAGGVWSGNGIADGAAGLFDPSSAGTGITQVSYAIGGDCPATATMDIVVEAEPEIVIDDPGLICAYETSVALNASPAGGTWSGNGISSAGLLNASATNGNATQATYTLTGVCTVNETADIAITSPPVPDAGSDQTICEGETATFDAGEGWDDVIWETGSMGESLLTAGEEGVYTLTVWLNGCEGNDDVELTVITMPEIDLGPDAEICVDQSITIDAPFAGNWSTGQSGVASITTSSSGIIHYIYPNSGCPVGDSISVQVFSYPVINLGADQFICPGDVAVFSPGFPVEWNDGSYSDSLSVTTDAIITATSFNGPCMASDEASVTVLPLPVSDLQPEYFGCLGDSVALSVFNEVNFTYVWSTGSQEPFIYVTGDNEWSVPVYVTTSNSCGEATSGAMVYFEDCNPLIFVPSAFTPDNDGINDAWRPSVRNVVDYELLVFNRWGDILFTTNDPDQYWMGNDQGGEHFVPDGVYLYRISYSTDKLQAGNITGHVVVIR
jgi:gliding motility-associated-like protein